MTFFGGFLGHFEPLFCWQCRVTKVLRDTDYVDIKMRVASSIKSIYLSGTTAQISSSSQLNMCPRVLLSTCIRRYILGPQELSCNETVLLSDRRKVLQLGLYGIPAKLYRFCSIFATFSASLIWSHGQDCDRYF